MKKINTIGPEEEAAALRVLRSGNLSGYVATNMAGGPEIRGLQNEWQDFFGIEYAVPCNSATSGLLAACMAIGVGPYDEVIVPYFTMSATAAAPAVLGATVILANIDENFCIDPDHVSRLINENTKAVIATNMFGHPAQLHKLKMICAGANITLIEDNAQAIMAKEDGAYTGTIGDIGVFSLNVHKHIQTGEGGICVTRNPNHYKRLNDAINHGECRNTTRPGLNLRMTEMTAAIAREQLKKLPNIIEKRRAAALDILNATQRIQYHQPKTRDNCEHSYYAVPILVRHGYKDALCQRVARRIPVGRGYDGNLLTKPINGVRQDNALEIARSKSYTDINRMLVVETCAYEFTKNEIEKLEQI